MKKQKVCVCGHKMDKEWHDVLERNYLLDDEKGILTIPFHFEKLEDFLEGNIGKTFQLKGALKESISTILPQLPSFYDVVLTIEIKDSQGHDREECQKAVEDGLFFGIQGYRRRLWGKSLLALIFLFVGVLTLIAMILVQALLFKGKSNVTSDIVNEVLDIVAWVFIWESATLFFIERYEDKVAFRSMQKKIQKIEIHLLDKEGKESQGEILSPLSEEEIKERSLSALRREGREGKSGSSFPS